MALISTGALSEAIALPAGYLDFQLRVQDFVKSGGFDLKYAFDADSASVVTSAKNGDYTFWIRPGAASVKAGITGPTTGGDTQLAAANGRASSITFSITGQTFTGTYILTGIVDPA